MQECTCLNPDRAGDGYVNVRTTHYGICNACGHFWPIGSNVYSDWKSQTPADWVRNRQALGKLLRCDCARKHRAAVKDIGLVTQDDIRRELALAASDRRAPSQQPLCAKERPSREIQRQVATKEPLEHGSRQRASCAT